MKPLYRQAHTFGTLFLCFLALIPLNNCFEVAAMMTGTLKSTDGVSAWAVPLTPSYIKVFKDIFLLASVVLLLHCWIKYGRVRKLFRRGPFILLNSFCLLLLLSAVYSLTFIPLDLVLMGIRGYWVIALVYAGAAFYQFGVRRIYPVLLSCFALHFVLQLWQVVTDVGYVVYAEHRSPGMFIIPATAGFFALIVHAFAIDLRSTALKIASFVSLLLSNSSTARLVLVAYYLWKYRNKMRPRALFYPLYGLVLLACGFIVIANLGAITGRGAGASVSALTRLALIAGALSSASSLLLGKGMGIATSQAFIAGIPNAIIADNTYLGLLYNAGILPALCMLLFVCLSYRYFSNKLLFLAFFAYSMTTVVFEINPVVQIALVVLGVQIGERYSANQNITKRTSLPTPSGDFAPGHAQTSQVSP